MFLVHGMSTAYWVNNSDILPSGTRDESSITFPMAVLVKHVEASYVTPVWKRF